MRPDNASHADSATGPGTDDHDIVPHSHPHPGIDPHAPLATDGRALRIGIGGPVGSGKTALVAALCRALGGELRLGVVPDADGWAGPAVLGGAKATGSLLHVHPEVAPDAPRMLGPDAVRVPLTGPASLTTATGPDAHTVRRYLTEPRVAANV